MVRYRLCALAELPVEGARGIDIEVDGRALSVLVFRDDAGAIRGFLNSCPHTGIRLDWRPHDFFDAGGRHLQCATHGALFAPVDGRCIAGPCVGARLVPLELTIDAGTLYLEQAACLPSSARVARR